MPLMRKGHIPPLSHKTNNKKKASSIQMPVKNAISFSYQSECDDWMRMYGTI